MHFSLSSLEAPKQWFNIHHPQKTNEQQQKKKPVSIEGNPRDKNGIYVSIFFFFNILYGKSKAGRPNYYQDHKTVIDRTMKLFYVHSLICLITIAKPQAAMCSFWGDKHGINFFHHLAEIHIYYLNTVNVLVCLVLNL